MAAHTPGPWLMRRTGAGCSDTRGWAIDFNEDQEQVVDFVYQEADARLIAAAPDLLKSLQEMVSWGQAQKTADNSGRLPLERARAAVAKAKRGTD